MTLMHPLVQQHIDDYACDGAVLVRGCSHFVDEIAAGIEMNMSDRLWAENLKPAKPAVL